MSRLSAILLGCFAAYAALYYYFQLGHYRGAGDGFAIWSYGQVLHAEGAAALYDETRLHAQQVALGMAPADHNPFPYPPLFLPLVWPLGFVAFIPAMVAWVGLTLAAFAVASSTRPGWVWAALLLPVTTVTVIAGQTGFLTGALLVGALRVLPRRPGLAGVLLGVLAFKPTLGLLVPVALVACGAWRTIAAATLTVVGLAGLVSVAFGVEVWGEWLGALPGYMERFDRTSLRYELMPTTTAALLGQGFSRGAAQVGQAAACLVAVLATWRVFRQGASPRALVVLTAATFVATPHAFVYDMPMLGGATLLWVQAGVRGWERALAVVLLCLPVPMLWSPVTLGPVLLLPALLLAFVGCSRAQNQGS